jgi:hypothetical protein
MGGNIHEAHRGHSNSALWSLGNPYTRSLCVESSCGRSLTNQYSSCRRTSVLSGLRNIGWRSSRSWIAISVSHGLVGTVASYLGDMVYEEVVLRMIRLVFVTHEERWIDVWLKNLTGDWLRRVEEHFAGVNGSDGKPSLLQSFSTRNCSAASVCLTSSFPSSPSSYRS